MEKKKWFFGWTNIKWAIKELMKIGSNEPSFFSQKRVQQGIAFWIWSVGWSAVLVQLLTKVTPMSEYLLWATPPLSICGFMVYHTQKEKLGNKEEIVEEIPTTNAN